MSNKKKYIHLLTTEAKVNNLQKKFNFKLEKFFSMDVKNFYLTLENGKLSYTKKKDNNQNYENMTINNFCISFSYKEISQL